MVGATLSSNVSAVKRSSKEDLPTLESPTSSTCGIVENRLNVIHKVTATLLMCWCTQTTPMIRSGAGKIQLPRSYTYFQQVVEGLVHQQKIFNDVCQSTLVPKNQDPEHDS